MQRKRRFEESNGGDPDVQVLSVKKPKLTHTGWFQSSVIQRMSQWVQNKFSYRSHKTNTSQKTTTSSINGNGNGISSTGVGRPEGSSTHHGFASVSQSYQQGKWPVDDRASGGTYKFGSLTRPPLHNGTHQPPNHTLPGHGEPDQKGAALNAARNKFRFTAGESVRLDDKVRYKQLLQKFTSVDLKPVGESTRLADIVKRGPSAPQLPKFYFRSNDSILGSASSFIDSSNKAKDSHTIKVQPEQISTRTHLHNGRPLEEESFLQMTDISVIPTISSTTKSRKSDVIDLTDDTESVVSDNNRCRNFKSTDYRDSKFVTDHWIKDLKATYSAKARDNERKIAEAELKAKIYDERRKEEDDNLARKIRHQMWLHRKEPVVIEDPPISDIESSEDEVEIVEEKEETLPELTDEMLNVINNALSRGNPSQVLVDKFRQQITKADIATLAGLNWLNDEVINFYMNLLMERGEKNGNAKVYAFNTFFYPKIMSGGQSSVKRWTRRVDVLAVDYILIPVHLGMHWCLAVINFKQKDIQYFDSMGGNNTQCLSALKKYLCDESLDKKKKEFDLNGWKTTMLKDIPQQMNGSDCGMFACKYAEYVTREVPISFTQEDMPYFRKRMVYEIVSAQLLQ